MRTTALLALLAATSALAAAPVATGPHRIQHAVVITVDGLRPDALAEAPAIRSLAAGGRVSMTARAVETPETLASHMTMATGLPASRHGVTWNDDREAPPAAPTLFTRAHEAGLSSALFYGKAKLTALAPGTSAGERWGPTPGGNKERGKPKAVAARFAEVFARDAPALSWVHLLQPDAAGHKHGWMTPEYFAGVREADAAVAMVLEAIARSPKVRSTAILLTADHGGEGTSHGVGRGETSWVIPFICVAPGLTPGELEPAPTLAAVGPTVAAWLGLKPLPDAAAPAKACLVD